MEKILRLGYSPCPNDTFIFYAMANGKINLEAHRLDITLADVEVLNRMARDSILDVTKVSTHAILNLLDDYWLLRSGGALGHGCGPLVVAKESTTMDRLRDKSIAIPGRMTTAHLLLELHGSHRGPRVEMPFDSIMPAVAQGKVEAGVIIHEGRFTYPSMGLQLALDLGKWWEDQTGLPLPLGGILMRRSLGRSAAERMQAAIHESILYARKNPQEAWPYIELHAQEMEPDVIRRHVRK